MWKKIYQPIHPSIKWVMAFFALSLCLLCIFPRPTFKTPYATVLTDRHGQLLAAQVADDGQWRFAPGDSVPWRFKESIRLFEDEYYYRHPGINPASLVRALWQNVQHSSVKSGGSTLTMQVARLARPAPRTLPNKMIEMFRAIQLELFLSKDSIMTLYAAHAPFGGNTVGIEAAAWRYFNHPPHELTWGESALLAVLPNAPGLMHPGKNQELLRQKRDRLLNKLHHKNIIDETTLHLALMEPIPVHPRQMPQLTPHLLDQRIVHHKGSTYATTIDLHLQELASHVVNRHSRLLARNEIHNAAAIIASVETGEVVAYVGNSTPLHHNKGHQVDVVRAPRSSGSILKPLLYAAAMQDGLILPGSLIPDVPTFYRSFAPRNYQRRFDGAVPAGAALSRSLNVPFVRLLDQYGGEKFLNDLHKLGFSTMEQPYGHYGLSLILGGSESTLWDLAGAYAALARTLNRYVRENGIYLNTDLRPLHLSLKEQSNQSQPTEEPKLFQSSVIHATLSALTGTQRPPEESGWEHFSSSQRIAWKTGTSFGFRDAWSVGVTPQYVVAVWAGNASGEGRPGIIGGIAAAPIMFELFGLLNAGAAFETPYDDMVQVAVCSESGFRASQFCQKADTLFIPNTIKKSPPCPYHHRVHLTADGRYRTSIECEPPGTIRSETFFTLPPLMEWYYRPLHPGYRTLPPMKPDCGNDVDINPMDFIYPPANTTIYIPTTLDGDKTRLVIRAVHRHPEATIHWHINGQYMGSTNQIHDMEYLPDTGRHLITLIDDSGNQIKRTFNCK
ncbi:penicillin-binding protein 1C [Alkaliflexus imshenetskii]|uniref:penicillin-binding protein 1C n=1 Tax=Alkaliflexus imshenetskii TaxID=286730 RepID=UPI00047D7911|nr:penicillin-binding protein 1C [Alkaliflexus imshenetskii]